MATSKITTPIEPCTQLLAWGTYTSGSQGTDYTLSKDLIPKSLLCVKFGAGGRFQYFCFVPDVFGGTDVITFPVPGEAHFFRLMFPAVNKITYYTDSNHDMKIAFEFPLIRGI